MICDISKIEMHAKHMRKHMLDMGKHAGNHAAHMGGALSIAEVMATLYFGVTNVIEEGVDSPKRDRIILSKGHSSLGLYSALIEAEIMPREKMETFEDDYSDLLGHPVQNRSLGIEFTNGSLGMGLSIASGVAIALKKKNIDSKVYTILGDGECNEGSCWEAFMAAPKFALNNLVAIIDCNGYQLSGSIENVMPNGNMSDKLSSFGWETVDVDGHNIEELVKVLDRGQCHSRPLAVIMHTIKGKGLSFAEGDNSWHHAIVTQKAYEQGLSELGFKE